jgi:predicted ATP-grasp superfamily ATP-dependent carboligase
VSIENQEIVDICYHVLRDLHWIGFADFDLIENPNTGELLIMEINPRVPACIRTVIKSGIDYASIIADLTMDRPVKQYQYKPGKSLRFIGLDVLWFLVSDSRFNTQPSWFHFLGKNIYYQDWVGGNFVSFAVGLLNNLMKQLSPSFRNAKNGVNL